MRQIQSILNQVSGLRSFSSNSYRLLLIPTTQQLKVAAGDLPHWADATEKILLLQPSPAAADRAFSLLQNSIVCDVNL